MNTNGPLRAPGNGSANTAFASAMQNRSAAEFENTIGSSQNSQGQELKGLAAAMARAGGTTVPTENTSSFMDGEAKKYEDDNQRSLAIHRDINQIYGVTEVLNQRRDLKRQEEAQGLEQAKREIASMMAQKPQVALAVQDENKAIFGSIGDQGVEGTGAHNFLDHVRQEFMEAVQRENSAARWRQAQQEKLAKQQRQQSGGEGAPKGSHQEGREVHRLFENPEDNLATQGA